MSISLLDKRFAIKLGNKDIVAAVKETSASSSRFEISERTHENHVATYKKIGQRMYIPTSGKVPSNKEIEEFIISRYLEQLTTKQINKAEAIIKYQTKVWTINPNSVGSEYVDDIVIKNVLGSTKFKNKIISTTSRIDKFLQDCTNIVMDFRDAQIVKMPATLFPIVEYVGIWVNYEPLMDLWMNEVDDNLNPLLLTVNRFNSIEEAAKQKSISI